jgi:hypothetical protein
MVPICVLNSPIYDPMTITYSDHVMFWKQPYWDDFSKNNKNISIAQLALIINALDFWMCVQFPTVLPILSKSDIDELCELVPLDNIFMVKLKVLERLDYKNVNMHICKKFKYPNETIVFCKDHLTLDVVKALLTMQNHNHIYNIIAQFCTEDVLDAIEFPPITDSHIVMAIRFGNIHFLNYAGSKKYKFTVNNFKECIFNGQLTCAECISLCENITSDDISILFANSQLSELDVLMRQIYIYRKLLPQNENIHMYPPSDTCAIMKYLNYVAFNKQYCLSNCANYHDIDSFKYQLNLISEPYSAFVKNAIICSIYTLEFALIGIDKLTMEVYISHAQHVFNTATYKMFLRLNIEYFEFLCKNGVKFGHKYYPHIFCDSNKLKIAHRYLFDIDYTVMQNRRLVATNVKSIKIAQQNGMIIDDELYQFATINNYVESAAYIQSIINTQND